MYPYFDIRDVRIRKTGYRRDTGQVWAPQSLPITGALRGGTGECLAEAPLWLDLGGFGSLGLGSLHYGRWFRNRGYGWAWWPPDYTASAFSASCPRGFSSAFVVWGLGLTLGRTGSIGCVALRNLLVQRGGGCYGAGLHGYGYGGRGFPPLRE